LPENPFYHICPVTFVLHLGMQLTSGSKSMESCIYDWQLYLPAICPVELFTPLRGSDRFADSLNSSKIVKMCESESVEKTVFEKGKKLKIHKSQ
jgi:hypothetical protein